MQNYVHTKVCLRCIRSEINAVENAVGKEKKNTDRMVNLAYYNVSYLCI